MENIKTKTPLIKIKDFIWGKKILIIILAVAVILAAGWWVWNSQKQTSIEEFCTTDVLEDCYGKKVKVIGTFESLKGYTAGVIVNPERREDIFLEGFPQDYKTVNYYDGKKVEVIGIIEKHSCPPAIQCWGRMVIKHIDSIKILENQTQTTKEVTIATDKTEYGMDETILVDIKNNMDENVYLISCGFLSVFEFKNNDKWTATNSSVMCGTYSLRRHILPGETLKADTYVSVFPYLSGTYRIAERVFFKCAGDLESDCSKEEHGGYSCSGNYSISPDTCSRSKIIYSSEFTIKEKVKQKD